MPFHRLSWRIGLPFVLLVLAETVTLVVYMTMQIAAEERTRLEQLAATDATFLAQAGYQATDRMATDLQRVTGFAVHFRRHEVLTPAAESPELASVLSKVAADGRAHRHRDLEFVAVPLRDADELLLVRRVGHELRDPRILQVLVAFWLLALLIAWLAARGLVRPLRHLAAQLPGIESPGPLVLPESARTDEIGDLARSFLRTRQALHDEREQRARAEKLAVLGRMTAALAHEIQNPVAAIKLHTQLLRGGPTDSTADILEHEVGRIENLLNQWLFLGRPEPPVVRDVELPHLLAQVLQTHRAQLDHAKVHAELRAGAPLVVACDAKRLGQVFSNLVTNATQAMPRGGTLTVEARSLGTSVVIEFRDQGSGFSAAALAHFAEFFFSEKEGGMGIGLSVANEIVKAHGGSLHATNLASGGAMVTVILPHHPPDRSATGTPATPEPTPSTT